MKKELFGLRRLTLAAFLLVFDIIFTNISSLFILQGLSFVRFGLGPATVILASVLCGPVFGAVVGAGGDILAILLRGGAGAINPFITIVYGLLGVLPYFLLRFTSRFRASTKKPYAIWIGFVLLLGVCIYAICAPGFLDECIASEALVWLRPFLAVASVVLSAFALYILHKMERAFQKEILENGGIPSPYQVAFVCLFVEIVLMVFLKSFAFYFFYAYLSGGSPIPYQYIILSLLLLAPLDVLLNTYVVSLLIKSYRKMEPEKEEGKKEEGEEELPPSLRQKFPWGWLTFFVVVGLAIIACLIVIFTI